MSFGCVPVPFVESQAQLSSFAESLHCVEHERDSVFPTESWVVHKVQGRLSKSLLSLWRRLSHYSTEFPLVVYILRIV